MTPSTALLEFGPLLARHERAMLLHLCHEIGRSGHPEDILTAHSVANLEISLALKAMDQLYSPRLKRIALDALCRIHDARRRLLRGRYAYCHDCGADLETPWLRRHPAALRCPQCLTRWKQALLAVDRSPPPSAAYQD